MPVTDITTDVERLTMTLVADFAAPVERLWHAFTQIEQLNRFFGPPTWPAKFESLEMHPGGRARYKMTGPKGETAAGAWEFLEVNEGQSFTVLDQFTDDDGNVQTELPQMRVTYQFDATDTGSRLTNTTYFTSPEALEEVIAMGAIEGTKLAFNQLDVVLKELREFAQGRGTELEKLSDTLVRITRVINGPKQLVWRAYTEPELIRQWMLGPDGWRMTACENELRAGGNYHNAWAPEEGTEGQAFGFEGENLLVVPEERIVTTERMTGVPDVENVNDLHLYEENGVTLMTLLVEYPSVEARDNMIATGMVDGMEASYARLEGLLPTI